MESSGVVSSNISYIQLAFNSLHTDVLTREKLIEYLMMIWDSGRGCKREDAVRILDSALGAKSPSLISDGECVRRENSPSPRFDSIEKELRQNREPVLMTKELNRLTTALYKDSRFIVLNGKHGRKDAQYIILSEWQLLNDLVHRYMYKNKLENIVRHDVIARVKSYYDIQESNVLFFPKVDSRFKTSYQRISLNDYDNPPMDYNITVSPDILEEIEEQKGAIIEHLKRNRETPIKIREIIQKYFRKQPYENIFSAYYEGLRQVLKVERNIVISQNTIIYDDSKPKELDLTSNKTRGKTIISPIPSLRVKQTTEVAEPAKRERSANSRITIRLSTIERRNSIFQVPGELAKYFASGQLEVLNQLRPYILTMNSKGQAGSHSFSDFLFEHRIKPGQKMIFEDLQEGKATVRVAPYLPEDMREAERLNRIQELDPSIEHPSARSLLVNYLLKQKSPVSVDKLIEEVQQHYPYSPKTVESILYKHPYFIQDTLHTWRFEPGLWNTRQESNSLLNMNEELIQIWGDLIPFIYEGSNVPAPHFIPQEVEDVRVIVWGGLSPLNRTQELEYREGGMLLNPTSINQILDEEQFLTWTSLIYERGKNSSTTRHAFDQKIERFFRLAGVKTNVLAVPTFPALRLPHRLKCSRLTKSILNGSHPESTHLAPLLFEQYRIMMRFINEHKAHVVVLNFDETEYAYFLYAMLGYSEPIERKALTELLEGRQMPIREDKRVLWNWSESTKPFFNLGNVAFERNYQLASELFKLYDGEAWKTVKQEEFVVR
ncbi:hypothetical protein [Exiguobacterium sp. s141]|nr:hypothetical protein [Exiguobacterium sp. s141]